MRYLILASVLLLGACALPDVPVRRVTVLGATPLTEAALHTWLRKHLPREVGDVDPASLRRELLAAIPLQDAQVERQWNGTLRIVVDERSPYVMALGEDGRVLLLDRAVRPASLRADQGIALWDRPVVRGCPLPEVRDLLDAGAGACLTQAVGFLALLDHEAPEWLQQLSEIRMDGTRVTVVLDDGTPIRFRDAPVGPQLRQVAYAWTQAQRVDIQPAVLTVIGEGRVAIRPHQHRQIDGA